MSTPVKTKKFEQNPCASLTESQAIALNLPARGEEVPYALGPSCSWYNVKTFRGIGVIFTTFNPNGLQNLFNKRRRFDEFHLERVPDIQGHPAVIFTSSPETLTNGECPISVGVRDELTVTVTGTYGEEPDRSNPCVATRQVADAVLTTLKNEAS